MMSPTDRLKSDARSLGGKLLDLLFPPRCVSCKRAQGALCASCFATIQLLSHPLCARCGFPLQSAQTPCPECRVLTQTITGIRASAWHEGAVREAIHALKYQHRRDLARPLAQLLAGAWERARLPCDFVTSVPLHPSRQAERGYNQAELLAEQLAEMQHLNYMRILSRIRPTVDQIGLDARARRVNVAAAFSASRSSLAGKTILLVDDVCTTGATLDACAVALFQSGADAVYGLTVARPHFVFKLEAG
jgi:ComF family protein